MAAGLRRRAFSLWTEKPLISLDDDDDNLRYGNGHAWDEGDQATRETPKAKTKKGDKKKKKKTKKPAVKSESDGGKSEESEEDQKQKKKKGKKKKVKQSKKAAAGGEGLSAGGGEGDGDMVGLPPSLKAGAPLDAEMTKAEKEINDQHQSQAPGAQAPDETGRDKRSIAKALLGSGGSLRKQAAKREPLPEKQYPIVPILATQDVEASMMTAFGPLRSSARKVISTPPPITPSTRLASLRHSAYQPSGRRTSSYDALLVSPRRSSLGSAVPVSSASAAAPPPATSRSASSSPTHSPSVSGRRRAASQYQPATSTGTAAPSPLAQSIRAM